MTHSNTGAAPLLLENLSLFNSPNRPLDILDLACGSGRNGLVLAEMGHAVTFADRDEEKLAAIARSERFDSGHCRTWLVDLEIANSEPLKGRSYDAILVFNYLHRPILSAIKSAVAPTGLLMYETFTQAQRAFGRPSNPEFLLQPGELEALCADWQIVQYFEGELSAPARAVASVIARRP